EFLRDDQRRVIGIDEPFEQHRQPVTRLRTRSHRQKHRKSCKTSTYHIETPILEGGRAHCSLAHGARNGAIRSMATRRKSARKAMIAIAAKTVSVCMRALACTMTKPSPADAPTHSPMTAPS